MIITQNWRIDTDNEGCTLIYSEEKVRQEGKNKGETYLFEQPYYYPTVYHCLKAYLNKSLEDAKDVKDCVALIDSTYDKIRNLTKQSL